MDDRNFQQKLTELVNEIDHLPSEERERLRNLAEETRKRQSRMKEMISNLTENLDYLRLSVKYLVFDLEATRRENKYLRDMLEKRQNDEGSDFDDSF